jgi:hypothetical protein
MTYHRFPNLREMFARDLSKKLTGPRGTSKCQYGGICRVPIVIYKIICKITNKIYIRDTQQNFKKRMTGPFQDIKKLMEKGVHLDSYARHVASIWPRGAAALSPGIQWDLIECKIIW